MTVKNLIEKLKEYPEDMEVLIKSNDGEFDYEPIEEITKKEVLFSEENGVEEEPLAKVNCLILGED